MQLHCSLARLILTSISKVPAVNNTQFIFKFKAFVRYSGGVKNYDRLETHT